MAESVVSSAVEHIVSLISEETHEGELDDVASDAKAVHEELEDIKKLVAAAQDDKEQANKEKVRTLLTKATKFAYNAEDVVDTYVIESNQSHGLVKYYKTHKTSKKLRKLHSEMQTVKKQYGQGGTSNPKESRAGGRRSQSSLSHRQADDEHVVGILQNQVEDLANKLTDGNGKGKGKGKALLEYNHFDVLVIVGMGGSGKTTLARNIYNHPRIEKHFRYQAWITLFKGWTAPDVIFELTAQLTRKKESEFGDVIRNLLKIKKCLLVLDDVWDWKFLNEELLPKLVNRDDKNHPDAVWDQFKQTKILITTRLRPNLSNLPLNWSLYDMELLDDEDSLELFDKVLKSHDGKELAKEYHSLAKEMLKQCGGLPLAIAALGKLLKNNDTIQGWERVFSQLTSQEGPKDLYLPLNEIMVLSYKALPYYIKPCFLYLGLFPENYHIRAGVLIRMWIAEGFVQKKYSEDESAEKTLEDVARQFLQKLIDNTMVQVVTKTFNGSVKTIRIHDIMREVCIKEAMELDFLTVYASQTGQTTNKYSRRAAINISKCSTLPLENTLLRSLLLHEHQGVVKRTDKANQHTVVDLKIVCDNFVLLRVLDINGIKTIDGVMPKEIGNLIHLRYLRIRSTNIRQLPNTIGKLRKLLTLDYWNVSVDKNGVKLPDVLWKLSNLRHLYLPYEMNNTRKSLKLHKIKNLMTLWGVRGGNWMKKEMSNLNSKLNKLCIQGISSPELMHTVFNCPVIKTLDSLYSLALDWYSFPLEGLEALSKKTGLQKLKLMGKAPDHPNPAKFPSNLRKLELYYTQLEQPESIEALGQLQCLKFLKLAKDSYTGIEWIIGKEAFPNLEELKLSELKLQNIELEKGAMSQLKKLSIASCTTLERIPEGLKFISTLERLNIERMPRSFNIRLWKQKSGEDKGGEDLHIITHIPNIGIYDSSASLIL